MLRQRPAPREGRRTRPDSRVQWRSWAVPTNRHQSTAPRPRARTVVHAQVALPGGDEALDHRHHLVGVAAAPHAHGHGFPGALINDIQQLQTRWSAVSSNRKSSAHTWLGRSAGTAPTRVETAPLALARCGPLEALRSPQALRTLAVDGPSLSAQDRMGGLPASARMGRGPWPKAPPQLGLGVGDGPGSQALGGAVLAGDATGPALGDPEAFRQGHDDPTSALRGQKFPRPAP
jgi:hypothetical protein